MFVIMRKLDVCIQFSSMDVNSIPNLRPVGVLSLSKNLLQSEKALQTVDTEFNTGNAFGKYCQLLEMEKTNVNKDFVTNVNKERFCGYSLFGDS